MPTPSNFQRVTQDVVNRARANGFVLSREIREELAQAGEPVSRWKEVVRDAAPHLALRNGRYYYVSRVRARMREGHRNLLGVKRATRNLIRTYKASSIQKERRSHQRIHFILPVKILTEDGRELHVLTQDISLNGVRVVGAYDLRGQKVRVRMPSIDNGSGQWTFSVHFLWSAKTGDNLIESGGIFLEVSEQ